MELITYTQLQHKTQMKHRRHVEQKKKKKITGPLILETFFFYHKSVDSTILNSDRPVGITALILLNETQNS